MESRLVKTNGDARIEIDGVCYEPLIFRSFRPTPANISLFWRNGIRLYQMLISGQINGMDVPYSLFGPVWIDKKEYDFAAFDRQMEMFQTFAPDSYYCIFIQLDTPEKWLETHPGHYSSFYHIESAMYDEEWKRDAAEYAADLIHYAEEKYGDRIFGYAFCVGSSCEWFARLNPEVDDTLFAVNYKKYCEQRNIKVDSYAAVINRVLSGGNAPLYAPDSPEAALLEFGSESSSRLVQYFAQELQKVIQHKKILGTFYGYHCLKYSTELSYKNDQVYADPNLDMIFSPAEYDRFRDLDACSGFQLAVNSLELNNKVYLHEVDHRTHLARYPMEQACNGRKTRYRVSGGLLNDCYKTEYEGIMVLRRELAMAMLNGSAMWWFDFFGGYFASPAYEKELQKACEVMKRVYSSPIERKSEAQVALIIDNSCFKYIEAGNDLKWDLIRWNLLNLGMAGISFDMYNACDIDKIDFSQYKLAAFLDLFEISDKRREQIEEKTKNIYKLWFYAPNYIQNGSMETEGIRSITGMDIKEYQAEEKEIVCAYGTEFSTSQYLQKLFYVDAPEKTFGSYKNSQKAAIAGTGLNLYSSVGNLPEEVWRQLVKECGVHLCTEGTGTLIRNSQFVCYQNAESEHCRLVFEKDYEFEELFDGGRYRTVDHVLEYQAEKGRTKLFLIL